MKTLKNILFFSMLLFFAASCEEGIDPISEVEPGEDEEAPVIDIDYPNEGSQIMVTDDVTTIEIEFEVTDDIEINDVVVELDDQEIETYNEFKDYRRLVETLAYDELTNGEHTLTITATDKDGKSTTETVEFEKVPPYEPEFDGEVFYMPFDGDFMELISQEMADETGSPGFSSDAMAGQAFEGAEDSYLTFPTEGLLSGDEFSAAFWYKPNSDPDRAGILVAGPEDEANPDDMNDRTKGFRLLREGDAKKQTFKLNVGTGDEDAWFDGGDDATLDVTSGEWVHMAFTISATESVVYINGEPVAQGEFDGVDWTGCDILSIMSGAPRFTGWDHLSDQSYMDELRLFDVALTQGEIQGIIDDES